MYRKCGVGLMHGRCDSDKLGALFRRMRQSVTGCIASCENRLDELAEDDPHEEDGLGSIGHALELNETGGRPSFDLGGVDIQQLQCIMGTWSSFASALGVSTRTLRRERLRQSLPIGSEQYTLADDEELDDIISNILKDFPTAGERYVRGLLVSRGLRFPRRQIRQSLRESIQYTELCDVQWQL